MMLLNLKMLIKNYSKYFLKINLFLFVSIKIKIKYKYTRNNKLEDAACILP